MIRENSHEVSSINLLNQEVSDKKFIPNKSFKKMN
jgi:hypothetical protein